MINWGIIGCGDVCEIKSGPAFSKIEGSALVAVMRRDAAKAADFAKRHGVGKTYSSVETLLADTEINAVYIATPPYLHKQQTIQALKTGRPVYVEKPMAMTYAECKEMAEVAKQTRQKLFVAYYSRALPYFIKVKEIIESGAIGKPLSVNLNQFFSAFESDKQEQTHTWRIKPEMSGGGYFHDLAPHALDILDFILGEIKDIKGFSANLEGFYQTEDTIACAFQFASGVVGTASWSFVTERSNNANSFEIIGTKGKISFSMFDFMPIILTTQKGFLQFETQQPEHIQQPFIETIVAEINGKGVCPSTVESSLRTAWLMDKILRRI